MKLRTTFAAAALSAVALAAPVSVVAATGGTGVTKKLDLKATINFKDGKYSGPVTGDPFGKGTATYTVKVDGTTQTAKYTATFPKGSISGVAVVQSTDLGGGKLTYDGTISITKGTKAFKGVTAKGQKVTGSANGGTIKLTITGKVKFPVTTR